MDWPIARQIRQLYAALVHPFLHGRECRIPPDLRDTAGKQQPRRSAQLKVDHHVGLGPGHVGHRHQHVLVSAAGEGKGNALHQCRSEIHGLGCGSGGSMDSHSPEHGYGDGRCMAYVIIKESLHDQSFIDTYTVGFEKFRDYVLGREDGIAKTPAWLRRSPAFRPRRPKRWQGCTRQPSRRRLCLPELPEGLFTESSFHRATATLSAMTGNIGNHGGYPAARAWSHNWGVSLRHPVRKGVCRGI